MLKCIKILLQGIGEEVGWFYDELKKLIDFDELEGVAIPIDGGALTIIVSGPKDRVDGFVDSVEGVIVAYNLKHKIVIDFSMEPFFKEEDYRGVMRLIKHKAL